ncbi:Uncharacterized protein C22E12.19 [Taphrina deformans PYCC 5710]|uniref:Uncharacterized protein C22E12.19 n=1 Tax=Taphrina deformans (strain PYCC 5710 / ATCC 11124 / CBS 356.35 / IMI 108563 / JCM 9778 / NBRC 8474) TaxID=1097556 RepID=R4X6N5_TAPDE|nr:Uncharacterized protein C22E12.19 [Taphrina deformans PYCC 5710]|eukprot:CCG80546.1 Uncharacterized protein C22E12.19 [Taphrina deformans PYCC 5710]
MQDKKYKFARRPEPNRLPRRDFYTDLRTPARDPGPLDDRNWHNREREARDYKTLVANKAPDGSASARSASYGHSPRTDVRASSHERRVSAPNQSNQSLPPRSSKEQPKVERVNGVDPLKRYNSHTPASTNISRPLPSRNTTAPAAPTSSDIGAKDQSEVKSQDTKDTSAASAPSPNCQSHKATGNEITPALAPPEVYVNPFDLMDDVSSVDESRPSTALPSHRALAKDKQEPMLKDEQLITPNTDQVKRISESKKASETSRPERTSIAVTQVKANQEQEDSGLPTSNESARSRSISVASEASTVHLSDPEAKYANEQDLAMVDVLVADSNKHNSFELINKASKSAGKIDSTSEENQEHAHMDKSASKILEFNEEILSIVSDMDDLQSSPDSPFQGDKEPYRSPTPARVSLLPVNGIHPDDFEDTADAQTLDLVTDKVESSYANERLDTQNLEQTPSSYHDASMSGPVLSRAVSEPEAISDAESGEVIEDLPDREVDAARTERCVKSPYRQTSPIEFKSDLVPESARFTEHSTTSSPRALPSELTVHTVKSDDSTKQETNGETWKTGESTRPSQENEYEPNLKERTIHPAGPEQSQNSSPPLQSTLDQGVFSISPHAAVPDITEVVVNFDSTGNEQSVRSPGPAQGPAQVTADAVLDETTRIEMMSHIRRQLVLLDEKEADLRSKRAKTTSNLLGGGTNRADALLCQMPSRKFCRQFNFEVMKIVQAENQTKASKNINLIRRLIFKEPQNYKFYDVNLAMYQEKRPQIVKLLQDRKIAHLQEDEANRGEYIQRHKRWLRHTARCDRQRLLELQQEENEAAALSSALAPSRGTRNKPIGFELKEAMVGIETPNNVLNEAVIPRLIHDPVERELYSFVDLNELVDDPLDFYNITTEDPTEKWTEEEQSIFSSRYKMTPKQFGVIAAGLPNRTAQECVLHYYKSKKLLDYRASGKPKSKPSSRGRGRAKKVVVGRTTRRQILATVSAMDGEDEEAEEEIEIKSLRKRRALTDIDDGVRKTKTQRKTSKKAPVESTAQLLQAETIRTPSPNILPPSGATTNQILPRPGNFLPPVALPMSDPHRRTQHPKPQALGQPSLLAPQPSFNPNPIMESRRPSWNAQDESLFIENLKRYGTDHHAIAANMPNRNAEQIQRHFDEHLIERGYRQYLPRPAGPASRPLLNSEYMHQGSPLSSVSHQYNSRPAVLNAPGFNNSQYSSYAPSSTPTYSNAFSRPAAQSTMNFYGQSHQASPAPMSNFNQSSYNYDYRGQAQSRAPYESRYENSRPPERSSLPPARGSIDSMLNSGERVQLPPIGGAARGGLSDHRFTPYYNQQPQSQLQSQSQFPPPTFGHQQDSRYQPMSINNHPSHHHHHPQQNNVSNNGNSNNSNHARGNQWRQ